MKKSNYIITSCDSIRKARNDYHTRRKENLHEIMKRVYKKVSKSLRHPWRRRHWRSDAHFLTTLRLPETSLRKFNCLGQFKRAQQKLSRFFKDPPNTTDMSPQVRTSPIVFSSKKRNRLLQNIRKSKVEKRDHNIRYDENITYIKTWKSQITS